MNIEQILHKVKTIPSTPMDKALEFYRLSIELERSKEPDIKDLYEYPLNLKGNGLALIDMPCNNYFHEIYLKNKSENFPKDVYVGLKIKYGNVLLNLLGFTIDFSDLTDFYPDKELLPIPFENFEVNQKVAMDMQVSERQISDINQGIRKGITMEEINDLLKENIDGNVTLQQKIYLSLSNKAIDLAQLYSELKSKRWYPVASSSCLLRALLTNEDMNNASDTIFSDDSILKVTQMDQYQSHAVTKALNNRVSVITGPPGTGKTQVIINILANALLAGKTAVIASKNNKAVDNVKERFDLIDSYGYLLRFGKKTQISTMAIPSLTNLISASYTLAKKEGINYNLKKEYESLADRIKKAKENIAKLEQLKQIRAQLVDNIQSLKSQIEDCNLSHDKKLLDIDTSNEALSCASSINIEEINKLSQGISDIERTIVSKCSGIFGFWYRRFCIRIFNDMIIQYNKNIPRSIKGILPPSIGSYKKDYFSLVGTCRSIHETLEALASYINLRSKINNKETELNNTIAELNRLSRRKSEDLEAIESGTQWIQANNIAILKAYIEYYLANDPSCNKYITLYKNHIQGGVTWKDKEYVGFINDTKNLFKVLRLMSITNLSTKNALPLTEDLFDILIIDEASQCDVASALPLIARSRQVIVIGDPMQLRHISAVSDEEEKSIKSYLQIDNSSLLAYNKTSLWDFCHDYLATKNLLSQAFSTLTHHYRCHPEIIKYSNQMFYKQQLSVATDISKLKANQKGLFLIPVSGKQENPDININETEAQKCIDLVIKLIKSNPEGVSFGITTPFRRHAERLYDLLPPQFREIVKINTVHGFQGDERDVMIYSTMVSQGSPIRKLKWIDDITPNLVNVAVTRAKSALYVVCDANYIIANSPATKPLGSLISMCK